TGGMVSKLYAGGGELVAHSSVLPCQGSAGARRPPRTLMAKLTTKIKTAIAITNAPMVAIRFQGAQSVRLGSQTAIRRGIPSRPRKCIGMKVTLNPTSCNQN